MFYLHGHCSQALSVVFDANNRHQRVPDDEAICPCLPRPGLHPLCPHYFVWVPGCSGQQHHIANTSFFVSIIGQPDSTRSATGQRVQISWPGALGHFTLYRPIGVCDLFWMLPWQLAYSAGVFSRWCFIFTHVFFHCLPHNVQHQKEHNISYPLNCTLSNANSHSNLVVLKVDLTANMHI